MENNENDNFVRLLADSTFKYMFKDYRDFFKKVIKSTTNVDISEYELYNNEINSGNIARDYRLDILLKKDNDFIIIEMNKNADKRTLLKARKYLYAIAGGGLVEGEEFKKMRTILINFNNSKYKNDKEAISVGYDLINEKYNDVIDEIKIYDIYCEIKIYDIYLASLKNVRYNGSNEKETYLAMFRAESFEEMRDIANGNEEALKVVEELERLSENDEFRVLYDAEKMRRKEINSARLDGYDDGYDNGYENGITKGKEEGAKEEKIEIAKNLIKKGVSFEIVSESTGLSIGELEELNK